MIIAIKIVFGIWIILVSLSVMVALYVAAMHEKEIQNIKSWYPLCELLKARIPKDYKKGGGE